MDVLSPLFPKDKVGCLPIGPASLLPTAHPPGPPAPWALGSLGRAMAHAGCCRRLSNGLSWSLSSGRQTLSFGLSPHCLPGWSLLPR